MPRSRVERDSARRPRPCAATEPPQDTALPPPRAMRHPAVDCANADRARYAPRRPLRIRTWRSTDSNEGTAADPAVLPTSAALRGLASPTASTRAHTPFSPRGRAPPTTSLHFAATAFRSNRSFIVTQYVPIVDPAD